MICSYQRFSKIVRFDDLVKSVQHCDLCVRLCRSKRVLSSGNGNLDSKVLFVAEAPGRLGADRTGIPLFGDRTGDNFGSLIGNIGWRREDIFITNAVLCNPKQENGNNATPTPEEVANCSAYLEMVITLVGPDVIVTLGATALSALGLLTPHGIELSSGVAQPVGWRSATLFPLYHPAPRAAVHRGLTRQRSDFMLLSKLVHPLDGLKAQKKSRSRPPMPLQTGATTMRQVVRALLELGGRMTYFKMTKLLYLVDLLSLEKLGRMVVSDIFLRQVDGPWLPNLDRELDTMRGHEVLRCFVRRVPMVAPGPSPRSEVRLNDDVLQIVSEVFRVYGSMNSAQIKTAVYRTAPMRFVLLEEAQGKTMLNKPVLYKNKTAQEIAKSGSQGRLFSSDALGEG